MFTATNTLLFDTRPRGLLGGEGQLASIATDLALVESQVKLLSSDTVLRRVVESERLAQDDEFGGGSGGMRGALLQMIGIRRSSGEENADRTTVATRNLSRAVAVKRSERTYVVEVDVTSRDPAKSARIANAIAVAYVADQLDARNDSSRRESGLLRNKLEELQARVRDAERRVAEYKEVNRIYTADGKLVNELQLSEASDALVAARANVSQLKARYEQVLRVQRQGQSPEQLADSLRSGVVEKLRQQYGEIIRTEANLRITLGPRHPQYLEVQEQLQRTRQLINEELRRITQAAFNDYQIAQSNARQMERDAEALKQQSSATNQTIVKLRELEREFEGSKTVLDRFLRARESMGIDSLETLSARVIAPATPPVGPSAPRKAPILAIALLAGLGFGVARALVEDFIARQGVMSDVTRVPATDRSRATAAEMLRRGAMRPQLRRLALPMISAGGIAGRLGRKAERSSLLTEAVLNAGGDYARAVDELVGRLPRGDNGLTLLVAGTEPGLGATTLASNIGWAAAARGFSVLLVDGDLARPALSGASGPDLPVGSLTLEGGPTLVRCLGPDWRTGPLLVPVMTRTEMQDIDRPGTPPPTHLDDLGLAFDLVVIDGPAMAAGGAFSDLARAADSLVLLVRAGATADEVRNEAMPEILALAESPLLKAQAGRRLPGFRKAA
jgi:succinoglycan biosynthesis transport protein ExoP